ncbi:MAG: hypothetical protein JWO70_2216 [Betaproteobacteria bacterium]|nr:hypothetical protein [Betaproteobacteria bacterium]
MSSNPMGLLVAGFDSAPVNPDEFNDWYDTEHVPERRRVPGFVNCERWVGAENPGLSIATYDLESLDVLKTGAYRAIAGENLSPWSKRVIGKAKRLCRFEAVQMPPGDVVAPAQAGGLLLFAMNVAPQAESDFNAWYDEEHIPRLAAVTGCLSARRFTIVDAVSDGRHRYLALYHLSSPEVCASKAWEEAAVTPWTRKVRPFTRDRMRIPLRRYERE